MDDYGLSDARVVVTPLASGVAAIAGVVLATKLLLPVVDTFAVSVGASAQPTAIRASATPLASPSGVPSTTPIPSPTTLAGTPAAGAPVTLRDAFNLDTNAAGLIVAAIFGLTPGLIVDRLQAAGDRFKANLQASGSTDSKTS